MLWVSGVQDRRSRALLERNFPAKPERSTRQEPEPVETDAHEAQQQYVTKFLERQRSTLNEPFRGPKNGEPLTVR